MPDFICILYGQSLAAGVSGNPALTLTQPFNNEMLNVAQDALIPLVEGSPFGDVETQNSQINNTARLIEGSGRFNGVKAAVAGADIAELSQGDPSGNYTDMVTMITNMRNLIIAASRTSLIEAVVFIHGAADQTGGNTGYGGFSGGDLLTLQGQIEATVNTLQGTSGTIPMIVSQLSAYSQTDTGVNIAIQQLQAVRANRGRLYMGDSRCYFTAAVDQLHGINTDYQLQGQKLGRVYHHVTRLGLDWFEFAPAYIDGSGTATFGEAIDVQYHVPTPPVAFSSAVVSQRTNQGFEFSANGQILEDFASISSVATQGTDTVRLTFTEPVGPGWDQVVPNIRYAYSGGTGNQLGAQNANSPNGNLVDSASANGGVNHALHSDDPIVARWDPRPNSAATRSLLLNGNNLVVVPSGGASGAWNFTNRAVLSFTIRINNVAENNRFVINRGNTGAQDWAVIWLAAGGGRFLVRWGGSGNTITFGDGLLADNNFHQVTLLFDVDQAANADRLIPILDSARVTPSGTAGSFPSTPLAGDSTTNVNFGATTAPDVNLCHVGFWTDMGSAMFTSQELWQSGLVRAPVVPDGAGGIPLPELFFPITANDSISTNGILNTGTGGATYHGNPTNMVSTDLTTVVPPQTTLFGDAFSASSAAGAGTGSVGGGGSAGVGGDIQSYLRYRAQQRDQQALRQQVQEEDAETLKELEDRDPTTLTMEEYARLRAAQARAGRP